MLKCRQTSNNLQSAIGINSPVKEVVLRISRRLRQFNFKLEKVTLRTVKENTSACRVFGISSDYLPCYTQCKMTRVLQQFPHMEKDSKYALIPNCIRTFVIECTTYWHMEYVQLNHVNKFDNWMMILCIYDNRLTISVYTNLIHRSSVTFSSSR